MKIVVYVIRSGLVALLCLNLFCLVYFRIATTHISTTNVTDYCYGEHDRYSRMTEGFGYGRMNNEGYNNLQDYNGQDVDILLMGSSQMEAYQIPQQKAVVALLNRLFEHTKYVYNIGISSHDFPRVANNFETAVRYYEPKEYLIIEIGSIQFNVQDLENALDHKLPILSVHNSEVYFFLQKIFPYLRLMRNQWKAYRAKNKQVAEESIAVSDTERYAAVLDTVMKRLSQVGAERGIQVLIFYHPHLALNYDGSVSDKTDAEYLTLFENSCRDNNIIFVNMADVFISAYKSNYVLPHGFLNTAVGAGHLNQTGHRLIAEELFRQIHNREKGDSL